MRSGGFRKVESWVGTARFWPGALDHKDVAIEILEHSLGHAPRLIDGGFDELNAAFRGQFIELSAVCHFKNPSGFRANASFVVANWIVSGRRTQVGSFVEGRVRLGNFQDDPKVLLAPRGNNQPPLVQAKCPVLRFFETQDVRVPLERLVIIADYDREVA